MPRGQYDRTEAKPRISRSLKLNGYQRDVLLGSVTNELQRVKTDNASPRALRLLAVKELTSLKELLETIPGMDGSEE